MNDIEEVTLSDILKDEEFWGWFIMGGLLASLGLSLLWCVFQLITGNDPDLNNLDKETGNFILFVGFICSGYKSYTHVYKKISNERWEWHKENKD